ncbi:GTP-binding protein [Streptomyces acidiscabies]|uniref:ATP/GTP-binding protein n=1 Tax=Streptomyces acidiscabies TaxID=42234 RepID=A0AAP6B9T0_9ACTN|nr:ATP/GTP-binding protein [Streptomyces acidiscabies]MBP5936974.1 ATP-binding protein [Streptomyces sp. LBUM 1476]MBZ3914988.1 ATP/GTP-binding protein [Streptomyces acidiscabies]MDX2960562.1 ATP/GTP-binding protein [Streptomyces acidiscabies]MDX3024002.1 ATP/GTP-binding protein [Streptomyces acidiscabies]MDX3793768.1 ATP/GTP-binding protein [Streptomyces acidiscabies]
MDSVVSDRVPGWGVDEDENLKSWQTDRSRAPVATKIVVAGGFGVGKTTLVTAVSEITPLQTEALMTQASAATDDLSATPQKLTTTVAMDFGRLTLDDDLVLYLFGTPGQKRFWFMWDDLVRGALGAVILADTRRLKDCFPALDYFESCGLPYVVAVNHFDGTERFEPDDVREALTIPQKVPVVVMDARRRIAVIDTLLSLVTHALDETPE